MFILNSYLQLSEDICTTRKYSSQIIWKLSTEDQKHLMLNKTVENQSVSSVSSFDASLQVTNELCWYPHRLIVQFAALVFLVSCCVENFPWYYNNNTVCNENKYNPTVDCNRLTQFSTSCLMWLEQSYYTVFPPRFTWAHSLIGFSSAFVWRVIELHFPLLKALTYILSQAMVSPLFDIKHCFSICETLTMAQWNLWFHDLLWSMSIQHKLHIKSVLHQISSSHAWGYLPSPSPSLCFGTVFRYKTGTNRSQHLVFFGGSGALWSMPWHY